MGFGFFGHHGRGHHGRFKRGMLKWVVLNLIAQQARHGYDIMRVFDERGWGSLRAGSVYPILSMLEEAGFVTTREEDGKRVYVITESGLRHLREQAPEIDEEDLRKGEDGSPLREASRKLMAAVVQSSRAANPQTAEQIADVLNRARKEIYTLLANE